MTGDNDPVAKRLRIAALSLKTGAKKGERAYAWTNTPATPGQYQFGGASGSAFLDGNDLYIYQDQAVAKYDFAAYGANGKPAQRWAAPNGRDYQPLYTVHGGRLLYQNNHDNGIGVLKTANGQFLHSERRPTGADRPVRQRPLRRPRRRHAGRLRFRVVQAGLQREARLARVRSQR